jgi:hypothetical protein
VNQILYGTLDNSTRIDLAPFLEFPSDTASVMATIDAWLLHGDMSDDLKQAAAGAVTAASSDTDRIRAALYVVLTSGEYQTIH